VAEALKMVRRDEVVIASKTYGRTAVEAETDIKRTLKELDTDYIDLFLLHEVTAGTLRDLKPALGVLIEAKAAGVVRAVGLSTHSAQIISDGADSDGVEFLCAPLNMEGSRIEEGTLETMLAALDKARNKCGKGVYVIKTLGAGDLVHDVKAALEWVLQYKDRIDVYNIGVAALSEMRENLEIMSRHIPMDTESGVAFS
jgi:aryl-alcohol dehydrogenase-like predicted oxidoreductase